MTQKYILQSNFDDTFIGDISEAVLNASALLRNIRDLIHEKGNILKIDCSGKFLAIFANLINNYGSDYMNLKTNLLSHITDDEILAQFIKEICILDSDILMDAIADIIIDRLEDLEIYEILEYLEIEDDFTEEENTWRMNHQKEYFISLNLESSPLKFPLECHQTFYSLKWKFESPMNVILARVCKRSTHFLAYKLSWCCKTFKNECDRYTIKLERFNFENRYWTLWIYSDRFLNGQKTDFWFFLEFDQYPKEYFTTIYNRRITVAKDRLFIEYDADNEDNNPVVDLILSYWSLEFIIPDQNNKQMRLLFHGKKEDLVYFKPQLFPFSNVLYDLHYGKHESLDIDYVHSCLIAPAFSKKIEIFSFSFDFFLNESIRLRKHANSFKFHWFLVRGNKRHQPSFKTLIKKYMNSDAEIAFYYHHSSFPIQFIKRNEESSTNFCTVSDIENVL